MNKKILIALLIPAVPVILMLGLLLLIIAGGQQAAEPLPPIASAEKAQEYQYVGSELGIPWEITLLTDAIEAFQKDKSDIDEKNPLITAMEFCILVEQEYEQKTDEESGKTSWELVETNEFTGTDEILNYIDADRDTFLYTECSALVAGIQEKADGKSSGTHKYEVTLLSNEDYKLVLTSLIGFDEKVSASVMELYDAHYLAYLYGYMTEKDDELIADAEESFDEVPVITGDVTREELARVAISILNWPYLLGAKSSAKGVPRGPLDCSGYVDWVYTQCFGKGVSASGGHLPNGVAVSGTAIQFYSCKSISESELKIGDLGFLKHPANVAAGAYNHVGIYIGEINGQHAFVHCGGSYYGYDARPKGRVGISVESGTNAQNPVTGGTFSPEMKSVKFQYFMRPNFEFKDDEEEGE